MTTIGAKNQPAFSMPANSRKTIRVNDISPAGGYPIDVSSTDFSTRVHGSKPIIAERAMYWSSRDAGTDTIGGYSDCRCALKRALDLLFAKPLHDPVS